MATTPVFLPGESHGQRSLVSYSPWGCKRVRQNLATEQQQKQQLGALKGPIISQLGEEQLAPGFLK